ncbi:MAG: hypothetical protein A2268_12390 [Candidatus Raymondbacteria bacterium RifOxyA12_full_50_37]|uniref:Peptidase M20 dimerisation domain-containing protein n=1 Tax=Candidatus Raymondbacteria bacterium RIFOXYD12_FULL_49_13 TaxID=1817890 RepID=A0A1F7F8H6_UNCRA|nr:MAG: hypothetical protein A2268_12390 [Candidatus Raymondbacteria bacterium RifOxyA12_full_50_37]OGJ91337.1 MAG: hypothetical protein A2248_03885 [Candidatus Raymondbacteria bacterium RIFOXYA2_FULL_49_16]OGJ91569.1 MAG: hypothetical protein A2350_11815 [Candidatus Raymondbacteria bacterium RifOxyB12_full_50_8]OGJ97758.1 MAG: hypothetical protein A2453_13835 [Candidatus Raymondbacteria bacterium RIFOXYC2_FULL_50_21]OGK00140.1 MAG: hypothetical protein A2487_09495 [Candidatus Raymondbacteria b
MYDIFEGKVKGLRKPMSRFSEKMRQFDVNEQSIAEFRELIIEEMERLEYDFVFDDQAGNIIGIIKGLTQGEDLMLVSHMDLFRAGTGRSGYFLTQGDLAPSPSTFKVGIISSIYSGAAIKNSLIPLNGDIIVCCVTRAEGCDLGIRHLFERFLLKRTSKIKGAVLCEPTGLKVHLGHRGRLQYEIVIGGAIAENVVPNKRGVNMLGSMFPLINELEKVSATLPHDTTLGDATLMIHDVHFRDTCLGERAPEFRVAVDRTFVPFENPEAILERARSIATAVYPEKSSIATALVKNKIRMQTGLETVMTNEFKPWLIQANDPFVLASLEVLRENGFSADTECWKRIVTEGSYICGELHIPAIGFGAGSEVSQDGGIRLDELERAALGQGSIALRNIGMPTFGWSCDEI